MNTPTKKEGTSKSTVPLSLEEMVPTLETCKKMAFPYPTRYCYNAGWEGVDNRPIHASMIKEEYRIAAPTLIEIVIFGLPCVLTISGYEAHLNLAPTLRGWQVCYIWDDGGLVPGHEAIHDHPAEAAAQLWLSLSQDNPTALMDPSAKG